MLSFLLQVTHDVATHGSSKHGDVLEQRDVVNACMTPAAKGASWLLIAASVLCALVFYGLAQTMHKRSRTFHTFAYILMLAPAVAYLSMLSGVGLTMGAAPYAHRCFPTGRWTLLMLEVPLLVVTAGLLSGMAAFDLSVLAISAFFSMGSGLIGGMVDGNNRWLMFAFALCFALPVLRNLWYRFYMREGDVEHEYAGVVANRLSFLCSILTLYLLTTVTFWALAQGINLISSGVEFLILAIVDLVFIGVFNITLLSDQEPIAKMSEFNARSLGWFRGGGSTEYSSLAESGMGGPKYTAAH